MQAGGLDEAACAAIAALRADRAADRRRAQRDDGDIAAGSAGRRRGGVDRAARIDRRCAYRDRAARAVGVARRDIAGDLHRSARGQPDMAADSRRAGGRNQPGAILREVIDIAAGRRQLRLRRLHRAGVGDSAVAAGDGDARIAAHRLQDHLIAGGKADRAVARADRAAIAHRTADQDGVAGLRGDRSGVNHVAGRIAAQRQRAAAQEVAVGDIAGRGDEAAIRHHLAAGAHHDALRIDEIDRARGVEPAVDFREIAAGDTVQRAAAAIVEEDRVAAPDGEALPVDDALAAVLVNRQVVGTARDCALSRNILSAGGKRGAGNCRMVQRECRDRRKQKLNKDTDGFVAQSRTGAAW